MCCVLQRGHSGDGCDVTSTLCNYDLRRGDLHNYFSLYVI